MFLTINFNQGQLLNMVETNKSKTEKYSSFINKFFNKKNASNILKSVT